MQPRPPPRLVAARARCAMALCAIASPTSIGLAHGGAYPPAPSTPAAPTSPTGPGPMAGAPGPGTGGGAAGAAGPATGSGLARATWEDWWHFNRDPYLDLRRAIGAGAPATGADEIVSGERRGALPPRAIVRARIVPELRGLLEAERSNEIATGAMIALARAGEDPDGGTLPLLVRRLSDANQEVGETAALALGILGSEEALAILESLLRDDARGRELVGGRELPLRTRAFAAYAIGLAAHEAPSARTRQLAARALASAITGPRTASQDVEVAAVLGLSLVPLPVERVESASAPWISLQTEIRFLADLQEERGRRPLVRAHAVTALARLAQRAPEEIRAEVVLRLLASVRVRSKLENEVLQSTAQALGLLGTADGGVLDRSVRGALGALLDDADLQTRSFAYVALAEVGSRDGPGEGEEEGSAACRNLITAEVVRGRGLTRPWAAIALGVLERRILDGAGATASGGGDDAIRSGEEGGLVPSRASREVLRRYFASARQRTHVGAAAIALGLARDEQAVPMLRKRLREVSEDQGQGYVALALGMIGAREAIPDLAEIARGSKYRPALLEDVAIALALLGDRAASTELAGLLAGAQGLSAQVSYAQALGRIGDERVVLTLLAMLGRKELSSGARAFAAAALGQVSDPELLPWFSPLAVGVNYQARTPTLLGGDGRGILEIL